MPTVNSQNIAKLKRLARDYRIVFSNQTDEVDWPEGHRVTIKNVKWLGRRTFESYATSDDVTQEEPWKLEVKVQAQRLAEESTLCEGRNESTLRMACEPLVFARMSAEVACKRCRKRIWRSEIEATRGGEGARDAELENRRSGRDTCRCPRTFRGQDKLEAMGTTRLFGERSDEAIQHEDQVAQALGKLEKPDRIVGLRPTMKIKGLLLDKLRWEFQGPDGKQLVDDILHAQPLENQRGEALYFPFLVLEAKSGTAAVDWESIQLQSAFTIRTFLQTQNRLRKATGKLCRWKAGPLVWFFSNRGDLWNLSVAFMKDDCADSNLIGEVFEYHVIDVWRGSIGLVDGALQLLLLIDHVFDWARDIYRVDIIKELQILASSGDNAADTANATFLDTDRTITFRDTDILSTRSIQSCGDGGPESDINESSLYFAALRAYKTLDSRDGSIRHGTFVESKFLSIRITSDNVRTFLNSLEQNKKSLICQALLNMCKDSMLLSQGALDQLEKTWTGNFRFTPPFQEPQPLFSTTISCANYLSPDWHQIRELCVIAIEDRAWESVRKASRLKRRRAPPRNQSLQEYKDLKTILKTIKRLKSGTPADLLLNCIERRTLQVCVSGKDVLNEEGKTRDTVAHLYSSYRNGNREPEEPFLRHSTAFEQQHRLHLDVPPFRTGALQRSADNCILVSSESRPSRLGASASSICAYLVCPDPMELNVKRLSNMVKRAFETRDVYHTTQNNERTLYAIDHRSKTRNSWNLHNSYGVYTKGPRILQFLAYLGGLRPRIQGSMRFCSDVSSGSYVFKRNLSPWKGRSRCWSDEDDKRRMFITYKLLIEEIRFWVSRAKELNDKREIYCLHCAQESGYPICEECKSGLQDKAQPEWVKNAMRGKRPFVNRSLDETGLWHWFNREVPKDENGREISETWDYYLSVYPLLDDSFNTIHQLLQQCDEFIKFYKKCLVKPESTSRDATRQQTPPASRIETRFRENTPIAFYTTEIPGRTAADPILVSSVEPEEEARVMTDTEGEIKMSEDFPDDTEAVPSGVEADPMEVVIGDELDGA